MSSKTTISTTRHEGLTIETVRECDVCYNTRYVVIERGRRPASVGKVVPHGK